MSADSKRIIAPAVPFLLIAALAACGTVSTPPEDAYYRLPDVRPDTSCQAQRALGPSITSITLPSADGIYTQRAILYTNAHDPTTLRQYHYHFWAAAPAALLQQRMHEFFIQHGAVPESLVRGSDPDAARTVHARILSMEQRLGGPKNDVVVRLELERDTKTAPRHVRMYEATIPFERPDVAASTIAFGAAIDTILGSFCRDLIAQTVPER